MRVLAAMSGGVDSSVMAARLLEAGHDVVGVTMKLWGGESDSGCCSVSDVDDARRVAQQLGIAHHVWTFTDEFEQHVVEPYVAAHTSGVTPNPCIECNRHLKFDRLVRRAREVGFDAVATGHHARVVRRPEGGFRLARGADRAKDQSYVLYVASQDDLAFTLLPVGELTKDEVRAEAERLGLRTAGKPDSQDVCFITSDAGRAGFLGRRVDLHPGTVVDDDGRTVGRVDAVELVTLGQRKGLGLAGGGGTPQYAVEVDVPRRMVRVGGGDELLSRDVNVGRVVWADGPVTGQVMVQCSAHGAPRAAEVLSPGPSGVEPDGAGGHVQVRFVEAQRRVAPGQSVVFYDGDEVLGGGVVVEHDSPRP